MEEGLDTSEDLGTLHDELTDAIQDAENNGDHPDDQHASIMLPDLIRWREIVRRNDGS